VEIPTALTEFYSPPTKPKPGEHHLSQSEGGTEAGEKADRHDPEEVEK
jgi:hypothetical protein